MPTLRGRLPAVTAAALAFVVLVLATWLVPYRFPPARDVIASSAELGFSNSVAYLCYLGLLPIVALLIARLLSHPEPARRVDMEASAGRSIVWPVLFGVAAVHVVVLSALYLYRGRFVSADSLYFQILLHRMSQGDVPFIDFSYYYGPAMLYPSHWLSFLIGSEPLAYGVTYVLSTVLGLLALYALLAAFVPSRRAAALWFVLLSTALFSSLGALNFGILRYLLASVSLLAVSRHLRDGRRSTLVAAAALLGLSCLYSLEVAAVALAGTGLLVVAALAERRIAALVAPLDRIFGSGVEADGAPGAAPSHAGARAVARRGLAVLGGALAAALLCLWLMEPSGRAIAAYPYSLVERLGGEHNVPVAPNLAFIGLAAITAVAAAGWIRILAADSRRGILSPFLLAYLPLALLSERGAISNPEPRNITFFGLPALLLVLHAVSRIRFTPLSRRALWVVVLIGLLIPNQLVQAGQLVGFVNPAAVRTTPLSGADAPPPGSTASTRSSIEATLTEMARRGGDARPYLMYRLDYYSLPVYQRLNLRYATYDSTLITITSERLARRAADELRARNALVVISRSDLEARTGADIIDPFFDAVWQVTGAVMPGSTIVAVAVRNDARVQAILLEYLRTEMHPIYESEGLVLLSR